MAKPKLSRISTVDLRRELERRHSRVGAIQSRRAQLAAALASLDAELNAFGEPVVVKRGPGRPPGSKNKKKRGKTGRRGRRSNRGAAATRAQNTMTLTEALQGVLRGKTMGVTEVSKAVQKAGYKTNAANFRTIVNQTLIKNSKMFRKVDRGLYTAA